MKKNALRQVVMSRPRSIFRLWLLYAPSQPQKAGYHSYVAHSLGQAAQRNPSEEEQLLFGGADEEDADRQPSSQQRHRQAPPKGYLAVYVGPQRTRFLIPATFLSMPDFKALMDKVAEEFGFEQPEGGLQIPCCEEADFQQILSRCKKIKKQKNHH